jgi:hypothetical protein
MHFIMSCIIVVFARKRRQKFTSFLIPKKPGPFNVYFFSFFLSKKQRKGSPHPKERELVNKQESQKILETPLFTHTSKQAK